MDIEVICNTEDDILWRNIETNSRRKMFTQWAWNEPPHDGHAVICGSGPSLLDTLDLIRWRQSQGQKIFALNNAANTLHKHGIEADYQVVIDARPQTVSIIGPAKQHLLCSQVDPALFEAKPDAVLFHCLIPEIEQHLPPYQKKYALVGGGTTCGLTAMCLAYTMGYRALHLFGYDSCHRVEDGAASGHAEPQAINASEPTMECEWRGKRYFGSITMFRQAELFTEISNRLIDAGCTITVDGTGLIPDIVRYNPEPMTERDKYQRMWEFEQYRQTSPGELVAERFIRVAKPEPGEGVIDFGCGTGRGAVKLAERGLKPICVDFTSNSRDEAAQGFPFVMASLLIADEMAGLHAKWGYCTDVMEHIDTPDVDAVITNIMSRVESCFFQISLVQDHLGTLINQTLHLTVQPFAWWLDKFCSLGYALRHAKDDGISATYLVTHA